MRSRKKIILICSVVCGALIGGSYLYLSLKSGRYKADSVIGTVKKVTEIQSGSGLLWGKLTGSDGNPLSGVQMEVNGFLATSNEYGNYEFPQMESGTYHATFLENGTPLISASSSQGEQVFILPKSSEPTNFVLAAIPLPAPVALFHFDETSGGRLADSAGTHSGVAYGTSIVEGKFSKARYFDGIWCSYCVALNQKNITLSRSGDYSFQNVFSLSAWIKPDAYTRDGSQTNYYETIISLPGDGGVADPKDSYQLSLHITGTTDLTGKLFFSLGTAAPSFESSINVPADDSSWTHVAATFVNGEIVLYINGQKSGETTTTTMSSAYSDNVRPVIIGAYRSDLPNGLFKGAIDEVSFYRIALGEEEIAKIANSGQ